MSYLKTAVGIVAGVIVAGLPIAGVEAVAHGRLDGDALFAAVAVGYGVGALAGTAVASKIAGTTFAVAVPLVLAALAAVNLFAFPHPWWFAPLAALTLFLGWRGGVAWVGSLSKGVA